MMEFVSNFKGHKVSIYWMSFSLSFPKPHLYLWDAVTGVTSSNIESHRRILSWSFLFVWQLTLWPGTSLWIGSWEYQCIFYHFQEPIHSLLECCILVCTAWLLLPKDWNRCMSGYIIVLTNHRCYSLDYRRNAFINITNLIRSSSNGLGWSSF